VLHYFPTGQLVVGDVPKQPKPHVVAAVVLVVVLLLLLLLPRAPRSES
jgi:hypothetical protein